MTTLVLADSETVANAAAGDAVELLGELLEKQDEVHLCLTGGTVGILIVAKLVEQTGIWDLDWSRVHIWWGDERFVAEDSKDRNALQAFEASLSQLPLKARNIHEFPSLDPESPLGIDAQLDAAVDLFELELSPYLDAAGLPSFDLLFLGMGPDGHVASLFPNSRTPNPGVSVVAEHNSPKPPSHRLSFSYEALNNSKRVWFTVAGVDKAPAVKSARSEKLLPASMVSGTQETVWYLDTAAAGGL